MTKIDSIRIGNHNFSGTVNFIYFLSFDLRDVAWSPILSTQFALRDYNLVTESLGAFMFRLLTKFLENNGRLIETA